MSLNFQLKSEMQPIQRRSFELAAPEILKPDDVRPLVEGEWLQLDGNYKMARGGDNAGNLTDEATVPSYAYFAERGRYDTQAIQKGPFLFLNQYEAETKIMDATALAMNDPLSVWDIDVGGAGIIRRGLAKWSAGYIVGYVTRLPSVNNGWLRFRTM